jgi:transcriptional regulator with XRE-family HTH domain
MLTAEQLRAARALLRIEQKELAEWSGVSLPSIKRLEQMDGPLTATRLSTLEAIRSALENRGVIFLDAGVAANGGPGVRLSAAKAPSIDTDESQVVQYREFLENDAPPGAGG